MGEISSVSGMTDLSSYIINSASHIKSSSVRQSIGTAVMKQTMDQIETMGNALVEMIEDSPTADKTGSIVDVLA